MSSNQSADAKRSGQAGLWRSTGLWKIVRYGLVLYLIMLLYLMWFEEALIFYPFRYPNGDWNPPGLAFEDAWFEAADGTKLHGWYIPHDKPQAAVVFAHGNAGNLSWRAPIMQQFHEEADVAILIFDYRGYGRSSGSPNEEGILQDARAARDWLAEKEGIPPEEVVLMGRSLGGGVMVDLAAKDGAKALILESTFTSLPDVAANVYPFVPVRWLMRNRLDSFSKISDYHGPLLLSHGTSDEIIPFSQGKRLFEAANEPKDFFEIPAAGHNDPQPDQWYVRIREFLKQVDAGDSTAAD